MEENQDVTEQSSIAPFAIFLGVVCSLGLLVVLCLIASPFGEESSIPPANDLPVESESKLDPRLQQLLIETGATVEESSDDEEEYCEAEEYVWHPDDADTQIGGRFSRYGASANAELSYENVGEVSAASPSGGSVRRSAPRRKAKIQAPTQLRRKRG